MNTTKLRRIYVASGEMLSALRNEGWRPASLYQIIPANESRLAWFIYPTGENVININYRRGQSQ